MIKGERSGTWLAIAIFAIFIIANILNKYRYTTIIYYKLEFQR